MKFIIKTMIALIIGISSIAFQSQIAASVILQDIPTATFVQVSLPTPLPILPTASPSMQVVPVERTATPEGLAYLEAITEANVRSQPDPESERLGTIRTGEQYVVIGRYFRWYQFQYNQSANGTGWVFDELVSLSGNTNNITDLSVNTPTPDTSALEISGTISQLAQTPGGILTATAEVDTIPLPMVANPISPSTSIEGVQGTAIQLPTFTPPPSISLLTPTVILNTMGASETNTELVSIPTTIPPILPIALLGGAGIIGLVLSTIRRS